jgi:hypothetical protein
LLRPCALGGGIALADLFERERDAAHRGVGLPQKYFRVVIVSRLDLLHVAAAGIFRNHIHAEFFVLDVKAHALRHAFDKPHRRVA